MQQTERNGSSIIEDYEVGTKIVDLSIEKLRHFREVLPQWQEADEYQLAY